MLRSNDGTPWTWQTAAPRYLALLAAGALTFHVGFGLGWPGTAIAIVCAFGGAFLVWFSFWRLSRSGPEVVSASSTRGRLVMWAIRRGYGRRT